MRQTNAVGDARQNGRRVFAVLSVFCGICFMLVLGIVVFGQRRLNAVYQTNMLLPNLALLPMAAALLLGLWAVRERTQRRALNIRGSWFLAGYFAALLLLQLLVARSLWFYPGWDVETVYQTAFTIVGGGAIDRAYFAECPNNAGIAVVLSIPLWIAGRLGKDVPYTVLVYLSVLLVNLACFVCMLCVRKVTESRITWVFALALCTVWIGLSLMITVPYSDTFAILFPILALYVYLSRKLPLFVKWLLIALLCFLGASIKPTALIFLFALVLVSGLQKVLHCRGKDQWKRVLVVLAALMIGAAPGYLWNRAAIRYTAGDTNPEQQRGIAHFLMMGMNGDTFGGHDPEDVAYSSSFVTNSERTAANLARAWERVAGRGLAGNLYFFAAKTYKAFGDGTMAQSKSFLIMEAPVRDGRWGTLLKRVFYADGEYNAAFQTVQQILWLCILLLLPAAMLGKARKRKVTAVLAVTVTGLGLYLLLFEVWPRYLYLYAPVFVVLAAIGLDTMRQHRIPRIVNPE